VIKANILTQKAMGALQMGSEAGVHRRRPTKQVGGVSCTERPCASTSGCSVSQCTVTGRKVCTGGCVGKQEGEAKVLPL
jgi:hypothetical protein